MNQTIKTRIEQIGRGEVPEGYKKTKVGLIPKAWIVGTMKDILFHKVRAVPKPTTPYWRMGVRSWAKGTFRVLVENPEEVNMEELYLVEENDLVLNITFAWEHAIALATKEDAGLLVSHRFPTYVFEKGNIPQFYKNVVSLERFRRLLDLISPGGAGRNRVLDKKEFLKLPCCIPPIEEQEKIAEILGTQDKLIALKEKRIAQKKQQKKYLMQQLLTGKKRLPGFTGEWKNYEFDDLFTVISTKKNQINKSEYLNKGQYPVIDQGKVKIVGYSNDEQKLYRVPWGGVIVFGDHTREVKYIDFDFIIGADGTQTLTAQKEGITFTKFMYYLLANKRINSDGYSRHFKYVKEFVYKLPIVKEQQAIADILSQADKEIELLQKDLEEEKNKKKALMQLLLTGIVRCV